MAGIFDAFTGNAQAEGQANARDFLQDIRGETAQEIGQGLNTGLGFIQQGIEPSLAALGSGAQGAMDASNLAAMQGAGYVNNLLQPAIENLGWGFGVAANAAGAGRQGAYNAWAPVTAAADEFGYDRDLAAAMSRSGLGLDDPSLARARFQTSPGYEFMLEEGLDAIARNASKAGMVASGNQMRESQRYGSGLADKEWDDWMNRLFGREQLYAPLELQGKTAAGQGLTNAEIAMAQLLGGAGLTTAGKMSDAYMGAGRTLADLFSTAGARNANIMNQLGQGQANVWGSAGSQAQADFLAKLLGLKTQANVGLAGGQAQTFVGQGDAEAQASKNILDTLIGLGKLGVGAFGGKV